MPQLLILLVAVLVLAAVAFGVAALVRGKDPGLEPVEPDGYAVPLPGRRPLAENDLQGLRFDVAVRGYRMAQVDRALDRAAYDIGYKGELITVLEAEVEALRDGRIGDADALRRARLAAAGSTGTIPGADGGPAGPDAPAGTAGAAHTADAAGIAGTAGAADVATTAAMPATEDDAAGADDATTADDATDGATTAGAANTAGGSTDDATDGAASADDATDGAATAGAANTAGDSAEDAGTANSADPADATNTAGGVDSGAGHDAHAVPDPSPDGGTRGAPGVDRKDHVSVEPG